MKPEDFKSICSIYDAVGKHVSRLLQYLEDIPNVKCYIHPDFIQCCISDGNIYIPAVTHLLCTDANLYIRISTDGEIFKYLENIIRTIAYHRSEIEELSQSLGMDATNRFFVLNIDVNQNGFVLPHLYLAKYEEQLPPLIVKQLRDVLDKFGLLESCKFSTFGINMNQGGCT